MLARSEQRRGSIRLTGAADESFNVEREASEPSPVVMVGPIEGAVYNFNSTRIIIIVIIITLSLSVCVCVCNFNPRFSEVRG